MSDICAGRHGGNPESIAAFESGDKETTRHHVYEAIQHADEAGITCDELAALWGVNCNSISGRFTELKSKGQIIAKCKRKTRANVLATAYIAV